MPNLPDPREAWPELGDAARRVLLEILLHGPQPRVRLAERMGLSRASLTRIARELVDADLVEEGAAQFNGGRGRPAESLQLLPGAAHFVGAKLTGDALYVVVTDLSARIVDAVSEPLHDRQVDVVVAQLAQTVQNVVASRRRPAAVGVAVAGDIAFHDGRPMLERSSFLGWDGVPLTDLVAAAVGLPATVTNDVRALAGAHHWFGGLPGHRSMVVYGIGAGIGAGVVLGDEILEGAHGRAGRVGHLRVGGAGMRCENGHVDCVHSFVTMPAIAHNAAADEGYEVALERARAGDERAREAFGMAAFALGAVIAEAVNAYDPEIVSVMGEGLDMLDVAPTRVADALVEFLEQGRPDDVRIERHAFHFDLYARGAAVSAMRELLGS